MKIDISTINYTEATRRPINPQKVTELASSIGDLGLLNAITIRRDNGAWQLVAGAHRLAACQQLSWETIDATEFEGDELDAELAQIDENLKRHDLTVMEQGEHLARRNDILVARGERATVCNNQYASVTITPAKTTKDIADEAGLSKSSVHKRLQIAVDIAEDVRDKLRDTDIADSTTQLIALARMEPTQQREVVEQVMSGATTVKEAAKQARAAKVAKERQETADKARTIIPDDRWLVEVADIATYQTTTQFDFIITDPPYPKEYLPLYEVLAKRSLEWLKPGGLLVAMCGQSYLPQIHEMLAKHLSYYWTACYWTPGQPTPLRTRQVNTTWKPILIYTRDGEYHGKIFGDVFKSDGNDKSLHKWGQSESGMLSLIQQICLPGQTILDPFCGAGTTGVAALNHGCLFTGIDIEEQNVLISRGRLAEVHIDT